VIVMRNGEMMGQLRRNELNEEAVMSLAITGKRAA
jgi:ABC-type sugar transport system ATPase subunit